MSYGPPYPYGTPPYQQTPYGAPAPGGNYPPAGGYPGAAPVAGVYGVAPPPSARPHARRPSSNAPGAYVSGGAGAGYAPAGFAPGYGAPAGLGGAPVGYPPGGGGYGGRERQRYQPGGGAPVGADPQLWQWFTAVDVDQSGAISAQELRQALLNGDWSNFDLDTVKMLMTLFDVDRSGTITFDEFAGLWKYIRDWQNVFRHFDADRSGSIDGRELKNALEQFGYRLTPKILRLLEIKYDLRPSASSSSSLRSARAPPPPQASLPRGESRVDLKPGMTFDRFVRACVATKHVTESFQRMDEDRDGWVQMNYEQFMTVVLTAP